MALAVDAEKEAGISVPAVLDSSAVNELLRIVQADRSRLKNSPV
jgi:hypothetical protein